MQSTVNIDRNFQYFGDNILIAVILILVALDYKIVK